MIHIRKSEDRGHANFGWLDTKHTFSFGDYYDPRFMGFSVLRVINQDFIDGGEGFPTHGHRDMEIISYMVEGALDHADTLGNKTTIEPGEVQRMTAGTGIKHSEFNHYPDKRAHLIQIWIMPEKNGLAPGYDQKRFDHKLKDKNFVLAASRSGTEDSLSLNQDVNLYVGKFKTGEKLNYELDVKRTAWIQLIKGDLQLNSTPMKPGDGAAVLQETLLTLDAKTDAEFLLFDMPPV